MKEIIQKFFGTTKKAAISITCALVVLALVGTATAYAAVNRSTAGDKTSQVFETTDTNNTTQSDTAASAEAITADAAKEVALTDAGLTADAVTFIKAELDYDNGMIVYDIEFYAENVEYEYEVNANTGAIYSKPKETYVTTTEDTAAAGSVSSTESNATAATENSSGSEDTAATSDTAASSQTASTSEAESGSTTASTGAASTAESTTGGTTASEGSVSGTTTTDITLDSAKSIALTDAGVSSSEATFTKEKLDYENRQRVYDIEFYTTAGEYEYEIRVSDGAIVSKSVEQYTVSSSGSSTTSDAYISVDEAKEIALDKAGLSSSDVTFKKAKLDRDDGIMVYEIEFYYGTIEYEVKINATTGTIIEYEMDT